MSERPKMLDFKEKLNGVLRDAVRQSGLSLEEKEDLARVARVYALDLGMFLKESALFLEKYAGNDRCEKAMASFQKGMERELSDT